MNEKFLREYLEQAAKFQAERDKQPITIWQGSDLRWENGRIVCRGGVEMTMSYGIYRRLYPDA
jgi:hypothetical protein